MCFYFYFLYSFFPIFFCEEKCEDYPKKKTRVGKKNVNHHRGASMRASLFFHIRSDEANASSR